MNAAALPSGRAWYRQFWPWFLIGLPALSIVVSVTAMVLAINNADPLVVDDWYKRGLAINQDIDRAAAAERRGIAATVRVDAGELIVLVEGDVDDEALTVSLQHPTIAARDRSYVAVRSAPGIYRAAAPDLAPGRWYVAIEPAAGGWRIAASLALAPAVAARLAPAA
jgi:hypothetical protein